MAFQTAHEMEWECILQNGDAESGNVTEKDANFPRSAQASCVVGQKIFVFGGVSIGLGYLSSVLVLDTACTTSSPPYTATLLFATTKNPAPHVSYAMYDI